jgi:DNA-binding Xre family transcriptional regulator
MSQTDQILQAVKGLLKQHKINYATVAGELGLSESSIKRSLSKGHISLERLLSICAMMDLELVDLLQVIKKQTTQLVQLTETQEQLMVTDVKYLLVTVCVCNHWTFDEILNTYEIESAELIRMLLQLERIELIELLPNNHIRLKISPHFHWVDNGPIQRFFERHIQHDFWKSQFTGPGEIRLLVNGMLSKESNELMQQNIMKLKQQFTVLSEQDQHLDMDLRHGTTMVVGMRPWELDLFASLRRSENHKIYR